ncbi:hypothetical protein [Pseudomonas sp. SLFW]|uniref:hypothetical protein n=1 Tax=Pseudomonas sp. SLFW TaxID=2683259 RepID=UPI00141355C8|nr:hypothetical protein [Pseudomonas sp. SLFW]NBB09561.1 hypothetical protein [Pseudomonas sp. SLFW]
MTFRDYIDGLNRNALDAYARRCGIASSYLRLHVKYASKDPSVALIRSLTRESCGALSLTDVLEHFNIVDEVVVSPEV